MPAPQDDDALGEDLLAALRRAVRRRLQADPDVPIGALLSGGLDSSVVAGLLTKEGRRTLFTVRFPGGGDYDEIRVAARSAAALGAELHEVAATPQALWEALPAAVAAGEGVAINLHVAAKYLLCRAVRAAGVPVLLTGEGADELWAGYAHLRRDFLLAGGETDEARLGDRAGTGVTAGVHLPPAGSDDPVLAPLRAALGVVPTFLQAKAALGRRVHGLLRDDVAAALGGHDPGAALLRAVPLEHLRGRHPVDQAAHLWTTLALSGSILRTLGDAQEMAHGIEGRLPFLDEDVVALARQAPVAARLRGGIEKSLLRRAALAAGLVTPEVAARPKHPFMAPPLQDAELAQDVLRAGPLPLFDGARVRALLDELPRLPPGERAGADAALMLALTTVLLGRRYGLGDGP